MAIHVYANAFISVANTALVATKVTVDDGYEPIVVKQMGNATAKTIVGMQKQQVTATFLQDFSSGNVHETLHSALGTEVAVVVRPDGAAASNSNPQWTGTLILTSYKPVDGSAGDKQDVVAVFDTTGTALTYATV